MRTLHSPTQRSFGILNEWFLSQYLYFTYLSSNARVQPNYCIAEMFYFQTQWLIYTSQVAIRKNKSRHFASNTFQAYQQGFQTINCLKNLLKTNALIAKINN